MAAHKKMEVTRLSDINNRSIMSRIIPTKTNTVLVNKYFFEIWGKIEKNPNFECLWSSDQDSGLMQGMYIDSENKILNHVSCYFYIIRGYSIINEQLELSNVKTVQLIFSPEELQDSVGEFALSGEVMYGITGAIMESILNYFKRVSTKAVYISLQFGIGTFFSINDDIVYYFLGAKK